MGDVAVPDEDPAAVGGEERADQVDQRGLARAVGADEREELAFVDGEIHPVHGARFAEVLLEGLCPQKIHLNFADRRCAVPTIPAGRKVTRMIRIAPSVICQYSVSAIAKTSR